MKRTKPQQQYIGTDRNSRFCDAGILPAVRRFCMQHRHVACLIQLRVLKIILFILLLSVCLSIRGFAQSNTYFRTEIGVPYIPVLSSAPSSPTVGLVYFNSTDKMMYKYEGSQWVPVGASVFAKSVLSSAAVLYKGQTVTPDVQYIYSGGLTPATCAVSGGTYTWYRATDAIGTGKAVITSGTGTPASYTVVSGDVGKYLGLGVTPATTCNASSFESVSWKLVSVLTPVVSSANVSGISGSYIIKGNILTASFSGYSCSPVLIPGDAGASSTYRWYYATDVAGTGKTAISGKTTATYTVSFSDGYTAGKYIAVGVTPVAANGDAGSETISTWYPTTALVPAYNMVSIAGLTEGKAQDNTTLAALNGTYSVTPSVTGTEGAPTYKWYYATSATGTGKTAITGQTGRTHTVNIGMGYGYTNDTYYLAVGVTPATTTAETGTEVLSSWVKIQVTRAVDGTLVNTILSPSGRTWMDRNLGATQVATSSTDYKAYGSLYQWCRAADGHQLINWTSSTAGTAVNGTTSTLSTTTNPGHSLFVVNTVAPFDWLSTQQVYGSLWWNGSVQGTNNPCPTGFHVPTYTEWNAEISAGSVGASNLLKQTLSGYHELDGTLLNMANTGYYWSSTISGTSAYRFNLIASSPSISNFGGRAYGFSVRCIKDLDYAIAPDGVTKVVDLVSSSGRTWMDRNLGATQVATSSTDYLAYGSLYQWCRASDGHEQINWTSSSTGTAVNGTTGTLSSSTNPGHSLFIINSTSPYDWLNTQQSDGSLWWNGSVVGANNPCPTGYHVPTYNEWNTELTYITNSTTAYSVMKLIMAGERYFSSGSPVNAGNFGRYWSSTANGTYAWVMGTTSASAIMSTGGYRTFGFNIRCIKN